MADRAVDAEEAMRGLAAGEHDFTEVLRAPSGSVSVSVARWPAGSTDDQRPHGEDEVYYVVRGRAVLTTAGESVRVGPGSVAFVAAGVEHRFSQIAEDLETLVFWAPARGANARR